VVSVIDFEKRPNFLESRLIRSPWLLGLVLLTAFSLGLALRLYDLTDPPLDFHPTRQLRVAIITRSIYYKMIPTADPEVRQTALSFARSMGTYEPPILENLVALAYRLLGGERLWVSRVFTSIFWLVGGAALFDLARRMTSLDAAIVSLLYYLFLPFAVIASRSFQPDPGMVMWVILAMLAFYRWSEQKSWRWAVVAGLASGIAVLVKVVAAYLIAGLAVAVVIQAFGIKQIFRMPQVWVMAVLMVLPPLVYYGFVLEGRSSDYFLSWTVALIPLVLNPAFYVQWLVHLRDLMGLAVLFLALSGVLISKPKNRAILLGLWIGYAVYGLTLPYQITTHSYYNLQLVPIIALSLAPVADALIARLADQSGAWQALFGGLVVAFSAFSLWTTIYQLDSQDYRETPAMWQKIASALPAGGKIVALTQDYGYPLMYYGWKKVGLWPDSAEFKLAGLRGKGEPDVLQEFRDRTEGSSYFLVTEFEQLDDQPALKQLLDAEYPVYAQGDGYQLFDLEKPKK